MMVKKRQSRSVRKVPASQMVDDENEDGEKEENNHKVELTSKSESGLNLPARSAPTSVSSIVSQVDDDEDDLSSFRTKRAVSSRGHRRAPISSSSTSKSSSSKSTTVPMSIDQENENQPSLETRSDASETTLKKPKSASGLLSFEEETPEGEQGEGEQMDEDESSVSFNRRNVRKPSSLNKNLRKIPLPSSFSSSSASPASIPAYLQSTGEYTQDKLDALRKNAVSLPSRPEEREVAPSSPSHSTSPTSSTSTSSSSTYPTRLPPGGVIVLGEEEEDDTASFMDLGMGGDGEGAIPNIEEIKRAKEKRERMRRRQEVQSEEADFISLHTKHSASSSFSRRNQTVIIEDDDEDNEKNQSRLVREDDNDEDEDGDGDLQMSNTIPSSTSSRIKFGDPGRSKEGIRRTEGEGNGGGMFSAFPEEEGKEREPARRGGRGLRKQLEEDNEEDENDEMQRWELEMIKKGTGMGTASSTSSSSHYTSHFSSSSLSSASLSSSASASASRMKGSNVIEQLEADIMKSISKERKEWEFVQNWEVHSADEILRDFEKRLLSMRDQESRAKVYLESLKVQETESRERVKILGQDLEDASHQYVFFQQLQNYLETLISCLNEKLPEIENLEEEMMELSAERNRNFLERFELDQLEEWEEAQRIAYPNSLPSEGGPSGELDEFGRDKGLCEFISKTRRKEERNRRRENWIRRQEERMEYQRERGQGSEEEVEEATEDEELQEKEEDYQQYHHNRENILQRARSLFEDTEAEYSSILHLKKRILEWKTNFPKSYNRAFGPNTIVDLFLPFVKLELLEWDPLEDSSLSSSSSHAGRGKKEQRIPFFASMDWYDALYDFSIPGSGAGGGGGGGGGGKDEDTLLIPNLAKAVLLPRLRHYFTHSFVPSSRKHNNCARTLIQDLQLFFPGTGGSSTSSPSSIVSEQLFEPILDGLTKTVEALRVPSYPSSSSSSDKQSILHNHSQRQFQLGVKLLSILTGWQGILPSFKLGGMIKSGLLQTKLIPAIQRSNSTFLEQLRCCEVISKHLHRDWVLSSSSVSFGGPSREALEGFRRFVMEFERSLSLEMNEEKKSQYLEIILGILRRLNDNETVSILRQKYASSSSSSFS